MGKHLKFSFFVIGLMIVGGGCTRSGLDVPAAADSRDAATSSDSVSDAPRADAPARDATGDRTRDYPGISAPDQTGSTSPDISANHFLRFSRAEDFVRLDTPFDWGLDFSVALKIRLAAVPEAYKDYLTCFDFDANSSTLSGWELGFEAGAKPRWWIANQDTDPFPDKCEMSAGVVMDVGTWHLITFVLQYSGISSAEVTLYVDGAPVTQSSVAICQKTMAPGPLPTSSFRLGGMDDVQFDADDLQLFDRALSAPEVLLLPLPQILPGQVLFWRMDEGGGAVLGDASGHGNTGTVHNSAWGGQ